ncbi:MAG: endonuclease III, partial [Actinomycetota bacterium]
MPAVADSAPSSPATAAAAAPPRPREPRPTRWDPPERRFPIIWRRLVREYPDAKCALNFSNPHEMLFATML